MDNNSDATKGGKRAGAGRPRKMRKQNPVNPSIIVELKASELLTIFNAIIAYKKSLDMNGKKFPGWIFEFYRRKEAASELYERLSIEYHKQVIENDEKTIRRAKRRKRNGE